MTWFKRLTLGKLSFITGILSCAISLFTLFGAITLFKSLDGAAYVILYTSISLATISIISGFVAYIIDDGQEVYAFIGVPIALTSIAIPFFMLFIGIIIIMVFAAAIISFN